MLKHNDTCLVSFTASDDPDEELLIVGVKTTALFGIDVLNAIQGRQARELWELLTDQKYPTPNRKEGVAYGGDDQ